MKIFAIIMLSLFSLAAQARCTASDKWNGNDKQLHFGGGAAIAALATMHTGDRAKGFYTGVAIGAAKELIDAGGVGQCSLQDFAVTAAGAALGAYTGGLVVTHFKGRTTVSYSVEF